MDLPGSASCRAAVDSASTAVSLAQPSVQTAFPLPLSSCFFVPRDGSSCSCSCSWCCSHTCLCVCESCARSRSLSRRGTEHVNHRARQIRKGVEGKRENVRSLTGLLCLQHVIVLLLLLLLLLGLLPARRAPLSPPPPEPRGVIFSLLVFFVQPQALFEIVAHFFFFCR